MIKQVELIDKFEFFKAAHKDFKIYVIHVATLKTMGVYLLRVLLLALLGQDKVLIKVLNEYADYTNVFSADLAIKLRNYTNIYKHAIKLVTEK